MDAQTLYEQLYCARGDMENRIKEQQLWLFADRTSAGKMRANQIRLYFSSAAYMLMQTLRRLDCAHTDGSSTVQHNPVEAAQGGAHVEGYRSEGVDFTGGRLSIRDLFHQVWQEY